METGQQEWFRCFSPINLRTYKKGPTRKNPSRLSSETESEWGDNRDGDECIAAGPIEAQIQEPSLKRKPVQLRTWNLYNPNSTRNNYEENMFRDRFVCSCCTGTGTKQHSELGILLL